MEHYRRAEGSNRNLSIRSSDNRRRLEKPGLSLEGHEIRLLGFDHRFVLTSSTLNCGRITSNPYVIFRCA